MLEQGLIQANFRQFLRDASMNSMFIKKFSILVPSLITLAAFANTVDLAGQSRLKSLEYRKWLR